MESEMHTGVTVRAGNRDGEKRRKGSSQTSDSRIRSTLRDRGSLQLAKLLARRETLLLRDTGANSGNRMEEVRTTRWTISSRFP